MDEWTKKRGCNDRVHYPREAPACTQSRLTMERERGREKEEKEKEKEKESGRKDNIRFLKLLQKATKSNTFLQGRQP